MTPSRIVCTVTDSRELSRTSRSFSAASAASDCCGARKRLLRRDDRARELCGVPALFLDAAQRQLVGAVGDVERHQRRAAGACTRSWTTISADHARRGPDRK